MKQALPKTSKALPELDVKLPPEGDLLTIEDKLVIRSAQVEMMNSQAALATALSNAKAKEQALTNLVVSIASKLNVSGEEYTFDLDSLTFKKK